MKKLLKRDSKTLQTAASMALATILVMTFSHSLVI